MTPAQRALLALSFTSTLACAGARPVPETLTQADASARSPATLDAATLAPQAKADADRRKNLAFGLQSEGKTDEAEIVGEQAVAAYELAVLLTRTARAEARIEASDKDRRAKEEQLALLDGSQAALQGEVEALELRARVLLDAEPTADLKTVDSERMLARRRAAEKLASEAESLCLGAQVLGVPKDRLDPLEQELRKLAEEFAVKALNKDMFPRAMELRSACLRELTQARHEKSKATPQVSMSDRLLRELTENAFEAERDDRGVIAVFRDPVDGAKLRDSTRSGLEKLGSLLVGHPEVPALVILHTGAPADEKLSAGWLELATSALNTSRRSTQPPARSARGAEPLVDKRVRGAIAENRRIEVVLVTPRF